MEYLFYGSENANVTAVSQEYPGILCSPVSGANILVPPAFA